MLTLSQHCYESSDNVDVRRVGFLPIPRYPPLEFSALDLMYQPFFFFLIHSSQLVVGNVSAVFKEKKKYKKRRKEGYQFLPTGDRHSAAEALWGHDCPRTGRGRVSWPERRQGVVSRGVQALFAGT